MLCLRIVKNTKHLNARNKIFEPLQIPTLLILEGKLINLSEAELLLFDQQTNVFAYAVLSKCYLKIGIICWPCRFNLVGPLVIYILYETIDTFVKHKVLWHDLICLWTICIAKVKNSYKFLDFFVRELFAEVIVYYQQLL